MELVNSWQPFAKTHLDVHWFNCKTELEFEIQLRSWWHRKEMMLSFPVWRQWGDFTVRKFSKALVTLCALICCFWARHYRKYKNAIDKPAADLWTSHSLPSWFRVQCFGRETLYPNELDKVENSAVWNAFAHGIVASHWPKLKSSRGKKEDERICISERAGKTLTHSFAHWSSPWRMRKERQAYALFKTCNPVGRDPLSIP